MKGNYKYNIEKVKQIFQDNNCELLSEHYQNPKTRLEYICQCGEKSITCLNNFLNGHKRCKQCGIKKRKKSNHLNHKKSYEDIGLACEKIGIKLLTSKENYDSDMTINKSLLVKVECKNGHVFERLVCNIGKGTTRHGFCMQCNCGENNPNWIKDRTSEQRQNRKVYRVENDKWKLAIHNRDGWHCVICNSSSKLQAHHLNGYNWDLINRYNVNNGVTLCKVCHKSFHSKFGMGDNTLNQFLEFLKFTSEHLFTLASELSKRLIP